MIWASVAGSSLEVASSRLGTSRSRCGKAGAIAASVPPLLTRMSAVQVPQTMPSTGR